MNQSLVTNVDGKNIYLVNGQNFSFYVGIPSNNSMSSIVLNLVDDVKLIDINSNNMTNLINEITNIYKKFNFNDVAVVTPVIDSNVLEQVKLNNREDIFTYMDKFMGILINSSYKFLKSNSIEVNQIIKYTNNPSYKSFNEWFVKRYNGRVELVDYNTVPVNKFDNIVDNTPISEGASAIANDALDNTSVISTVSDNTSSSSKEPGFVSYVLLGVIVAVISLVALYMLL